MSTSAAKRGDLVVIEQHQRDYVLRGENPEYDTFTVGVVTSVTRDGMVKMYRRAGNFDQGKDWNGTPDRGESVPSGMTRAYVLSANDVDVAGALATAACHVWITDQAHEDHAKAYDTLDEVKAAVKPHRKGGQDWERFSLAAIEWEAARRAASPMLTEALRVSYEDRAKFFELSAAYHAAVTAANEAYRATVAQRELAAA